MTFATSQHTVKRFDREIQQLMNLALEMGRAVELQVSRAVEVFRSGDVEAAQEVILGDQAVNRWDMEIDRYCVRLLSRRQPMSTDLRLVMALNKAVNDLERIGDEAKAIAKRTLAMQARGDRLQEGISLKMQRLAVIADRRVQQALDSFARLDVEQAWTLVRTDESDEVFEEIMRSLGTHTPDNGLAIAAVIDMALALKALKRVAERARNLAEYVIYIVEGQDIRHKPGPTADLASPP